MICINERLSTLINTLHTDSENNHQEEVGSQREPLKEMMDKELIVDTSTMTIETRGLWDGFWFWVQTPTSAI